MSHDETNRCLVGVARALGVDGDELNGGTPENVEDFLISEALAYRGKLSVAESRIKQLETHYKPYDELVELLRKPGLEPTPRAVVTHFVGITDQLKELGTAINQQPNETLLQSYTRTVDSFVITDADGNTLDYEISDGCIVLDESNRKPKVNKAATALNTLRVELDKALCCEHPLNPEGDLGRIDGLNWLAYETAKACKADSAPEQRYMVDDGIKPCTVLYSDEETTLVRTEDGDHMFNTGAIAWSDEEAYKVQELLKRNDIAYNGTAVWCIKELAKLGHLVITDEGFGADPAYFEGRLRDAVTNGKLENCASEREPVPEVDDTPNQFESLANSQASTLVRQDECPKLPLELYNAYRRSCVRNGVLPVTYEEWKEVGQPLV